MAFNPGAANIPSLVPGSPAVKRQKTQSGYTSTSNSAHNTGAYNSENDSGDELLANFIPDTPSNYFQTQPTQILDGGVPNSSPPATPSTIVQVPASSPFTAQRDTGAKPQVIARPVQPLVYPPRNVAMSMAPAGTAYRPPAGIVSKPPTRTVITIDDDEDDGPRFQGGSSDEDSRMKSVDIKPSLFAKSAHSSFGASTSKPAVNGNSAFHNIVQNAAYQPRQPGSTQRFQTQARPDRARPVSDINLNSPGIDSDLRVKIVQVRVVLPSVSVLMAQNALIACNRNLDDAINLLASGPPPQEHFIISDDEDSSPAKKSEPQMKRGLNGPLQSIKDRYSSTQTFQPKNQVSTPPKQPKKRLIQGRRNPSSPAIPAISSPLKPASPVVLNYDSYDSDSGQGSISEAEDPELGVKVLKYLNTCKVEDLVELTNINKDIAEIMLAARPFKHLDAARTVENSKPLKSGKKSTRAPIGDRIVDTALEMFQGYEAIDTLVKKCGDLGKPLSLEMQSWGFDVFGAAKGSGELQMTSFDEDRDSGIGTPSSGSPSNIGDDDVKIISSTRKRANIQFLKKPEMMAEDCVLKDYQVVGLNWLALMSRHRLSCILADEMGLGKTCQVIAFLTHLVETGNQGPHLVVCPGSTLENWLREFQRFSPQLAVEPYHGPQKERAEMAEQILGSRDHVNVIVTTYDMANKKEDNKFMRRLNPDVCVYDEGHMLKNVKSQRYQSLIKIPARLRLLLTGTPLQNNLQELAALLGFILPEVFKDLEDELNFIFKAKATTSDSNHAALLSAQRIARARSMLTPFVLRRKKDQVLKHLPAKTCRVEYATLHKAQKEIYDGHLDQAKERARIRVEGGKIPKSDENNPLMQLRKASIHPMLFRRHFTNEKIEKMADILRKKEPEHFPATAKRAHLIEEMRNGSDFWLHQWCRDFPCIRSFDVPNLAWMDSGKVEAMVKLVKEYKENGDRVLIFSQFSLVLDILEAVLNTSLIHYTRIDGSTKIDERQTLIDTFRDDESITVFLLTTKAGGTGINLMYANKVIIFDGSFNPQDDRQAENRAHRVGQTREVEVVRLVTKGTVEEQIYALGQSKLMLDRGVAGENEDDAKAEAAGEKAVSKMLLQSLEGSGSDKESSEAKKDGDVEQKKEPELPKKELPRRKKSSILDQLTAPSKRSPKRKAQEMIAIGEDGDGDDEMLL